MAIAPALLEQINKLKAAGIKPPPSVLNAANVSKLDVIDFGEKYYYIPETSAPIKWEPWQKIILRIITGIHSYSTLEPFYSTILFTSIKKIGKTQITGVIGRHRAESAVSRDEILFFANDETQSRGRAYAGIQTSIELNPRYDKQKRTLYDEQGNAVWRVIEDFLEHVPTGTKVRAVNVDYRGEAGANPSLSIFTEAWGFDSEKQLLLYQEMTPVLTRYHSQRIVESYAGYTGKSKILESVWNLASKEELGGRQLTLDDIPDWPWPEECITNGGGGLPLYVNNSAGLFAFIDQGMQARKRMPWTQGPEADKYYAEQALTLTPEQYERLHLNHWVSPTSAFIPVEWWIACTQLNLPQLQPGDNTPCVLAIDASVSGDCTAVIVVSRHPNNYANVALRFAYKWDPPRGGKLDYENTPNTSSGESLKDCIIRLCAQFNVVEITYDEWQLHHLMNEIRNSGIAWCKPFSQSTQRDVADKQLYDLIKTKRINHSGVLLGSVSQDIEQHIKNAARRVRAGEDTKLHIIKSSEDAKIDLVIALSMATSECLRLDI